MKLKHESADDMRIITDDAIVQNRKEHNEKLFTIAADVFKIIKREAHLGKYETLIGDPGWSFRDSLKSYLEHLGYVVSNYGSYPTRLHISWNAKNEKR